MFLIRQCALFAFAVLLAPLLSAQETTSLADKPQSPWAIDRSLTVSPQAEPLPALKYRLLPAPSDLKEGNAVPIYLRLIHEQSDAEQKHWTETPNTWNALPPSDIPLADVQRFLKDHHYLARQLEVGARRRTAEWNYTLEEPNPIGLLLPDVQVMRNYGPMLVLQVRAALAEKDFTGASHHLETGFAFSRHVGEGPTLIHGLVAMRLATQFAGTVGDFVEQPGAPNLYWALTALPRPLIDLAPGLTFEYQAGEKQLPILGDLDRERSAEQWEADLQFLRKELQGLDEFTATGKLRHAEWFPKGAAPGEPAARAPDLAEARKFVAKAKGLSHDKVETMPAAQVLLLHIAGTYRQDRDDWHKAAYLPYAEAHGRFKAAAARLRDAPVTEGHILARLLLPALDRVVSKQNLLDRNIAALRVVEALRIYAAVHDGKLPNKLDEITEVPVPDDPGTGRPFEYRREGDVATLTSQSPDDVPNNSIRYRVIVR
jgi:hypothetical protein